MRTLLPPHLLLLWLALLSGCPDAPLAPDASLDADVKEPDALEEEAVATDVPLDRPDARRPDVVGMDAAQDADVPVIEDIPVFEVIPLDRVSFDREVTFEQVADPLDLYRQFLRSPGTHVRCRPGEVADCACFDGREGRQICQYSGAFGACACLNPRSRVMGPPRLVSPLTHFRVSSQRPSLHWVVPAGTARVRVELCGDRPCSRLLLREETTDLDAWRPERPLAPGMVFWHVQAFDAAGTTLWSSPTWLFYVGRRDAPHDTALRQPIDFNGDGYDDVLVAEFVSRFRYVFTVRLGSPDGLQATIAARPQLPAGVLQGRETSFDVPRPVADFDGDGYTDLLLIAARNPSAPGAPPTRVYVLYGGADLFRRYTESYVNLDDSIDLYPYYVADYNGDGFQDVITWNFTAFVGSSSGPRTTPMRTGLSGLDERLHGHLLLADDVDGDGWTDLAGNPPYVYYGAGAFGFGLYPGMESDIGNDTPYSVTDMNGDRRADLLSRRNGLRIDYGSPDGLVEELVEGLGRITQDSRPGHFTRQLMALSAPVTGDFDGDGLSDVILSDGWAFSTPTPSPCSWETLYRYDGNPNGVSFIPDRMMRAPCNSWGFSAVASGDYDGDGFDDVLMYVDRVASVLPGGTGGWGERVYPVFNCSQGECALVEF